MKTRNPKISPPQVAPCPDKRVTEIRRYKLITPLFGGGVKAQQADPITIIRGASVRGQLRFWWRATRGGQFNGDLNKLRARENAIWGSATKKGDKDTGPSKVKIVIRDSTSGVEDRPFEVVANKNGKPTPRPRSGSAAPPYAAFPLQPERENAIINMDTPTVRTGIEFTMEISYPQEEGQNVRAALWAWETFGGIGGRTRRGFGALQLVEYSINGEKQSITLAQVKQMDTELREQLKTHIVKGEWHKNVPHLTDTLRMEIISKGASSPQQAWKDLIGRFQKFRQQAARVDKETGEPKDQGLSVWPEANALRSRLKKNLKWSKNVTDPKLVDKFPRAAFGLPLPFHMPHDGIPHRENKTFTLQGGKLDPKDDKSYERLASRLILKPLAGANNQYVGLAAVLSGPEVPPTGLQIKENLTNQKPVKSNLDKAEVSSEPLNRILHGQPDVIEAFLEYLKQ